MFWLTNPSVMEPHVSMETCVNKCYACTHVHVSTCPCPPEVVFLPHLESLKLKSLRDQCHLQSFSFVNLIHRLLPRNYKTFLTSGRKTEQTYYNTPCYSTYSVIA